MPATAIRSVGRFFPLPVRMFLALIVGLLIGAIAPGFGKSLEPLGLAFVQAIKMVVVPLIFSTITLGVYKMGRNVQELGRIALIAFGWFMLATLLSALIALVLNAFFHPGVGAKLEATAGAVANLAISVDWTHYLLGLIPSNVIAAMAAQQILPILLFAVVFGLALCGLGSRAEAITNVLDALAEAMFRITKAIIQLAPIAILAIMAWLAATQTSSTIVSLAKLIGLMYLGLAIIVVLFWGALLLIRVPPLQTTRRLIEPVLLAFTTRSSEVALPVHLRKLEELGVPRRLVSVVLPLGYSFNLDGSTMYIALACTFLAEAYGLQLDGAALFTILLTTLIASKGIANVPSGGMVALATVLDSIGLPVEAIALIAGVDAFMDMGRSAINVFGNTIAVLLVQKWGAVAAQDETCVDRVEESIAPTLRGGEDRMTHAVRLRPRPR